MPSSTIRARPAVVGTVSGGLGNQLFMYAAARALAIRSGAQLLLDVTSGFERDFYKRNCVLNHFNIQCQFLKAWPRGTRRLRMILRRVAAELNRCLPLRLRRYIAEQNPFRVLKGLLELNVRGTVHLIGYWQNEAYFKDAESTIREDLSITTPLDARTLALAAHIRSCNSVSLHFRRLHKVPAGCLTPSTRVSSLPSEYYDAAVRYITSKVADPVFFCFSDLPGAEQLIYTPSGAVRVENRGDERSHEELWLMSQCKHHIIANSTFSWWGAWLNPAPEKIVVSPRQSQWGQILITPNQWVVLDV